MLTTHTIVKFIQNKPESSNKLISRTLLKIAVVSKFYNPRPSASHPKADEFWIVNIVKETGEGKASGCFVVEPQFRVPTIVKDNITSPHILHLAPSMFTYEFVNGKIMVKPDDPGRPWIMPLELKSLLAQKEKAYALIVCLAPNVEQYYQGGKSPYAKHP